MTRLANAAKTVESQTDELIRHGWSRPNHRSQRENPKRRTCSLRAAPQRGTRLPISRQSQYWTTSTWHGAIVAGAKSTPHSVNIYAASKVLSERSAWDFHATEKPCFQLGTINPNFHLGPSHAGASTDSTNRFVKPVAAGQTEPVHMLGGQWFINVVDDARLHVLALTRADVGNERILAFTGRLAWKDVVEKIIRADPQATKAKEIDTTQPKFVEGDLTTVDKKRMEELLGDKSADLGLSIRQLLGKADVHPAPKWY